MRQTIAYYFLLLYSTLLLQSIVPLVNNWWDHQFNNIEHILTVHAQLGSNHVDQQILENKHKSTDAEPQQNGKQAKAVVHIIGDTGLEILQNEGDSNIFWARLHFFTSRISPSPIGPPPKHFFV